MYMHCRHIKTNGLRCESPALKGSQFCYDHPNRLWRHAGSLVVRISQSIAARSFSISMRNGTV
jgi:hypothetical protein